MFRQSQRCTGIVVEGRSAPAREDGCQDWDVPGGSGWNGGVHLRSALEVERWS